LAEDYGLPADWGELARRGATMRGHGIWGELVRSIFAVHAAPGKPEDERAFSSFSTLYSILRMEGVLSSRIK
jgi:hypothetical protein